MILFRHPGEAFRHMDSTPSDLSQLFLSDNSVLSARFRCQQVPGIEGDLSHTLSGTFYSTLCS